MEIKQGCILRPNDPERPFLRNLILNTAVFFPFFPTKTVRNAIKYHQWKQRGISTCGISTTPHLERAKSYADSNKVIAKINRTLLSCA